MKKYLFTLAFVAILVGTQAAYARSTFVINEGWNLVNVRVVESLNQDRNRIDELFQQGAALFILNPENKKYYGGSGTEIIDDDRMIDALTKDLSTGDDELFALGTWFYSPRKLSLSINFAIHPDQESNYKGSYHLYKGWNLVGITPVLLDRSFTNVKGSCSVQSVYHFEQGQWRKQTTDDLAEKFTTDSLGYALAVKVADDCKFSFTPKAPAAPQVPALPE